jgi:NADPH:quinone reductase-like Zn-dependent oxidoreductase
VRAVVVREHGDLDSLRVEQVPDPTPGPGEVLLRVLATSLNRLDLFVRSGPPGGKPIYPWGVLPLPIIPGADIVGEVVGFANDVESCAISDRVAVYPGLYCGRCSYCEAGEQSMCLEYSLFGEHRNGGLAEYTVVPARNCFRVPNDTSPEKLAAGPVAYTTAWRMLMVAAGLRAGEWVLIQGVGGGVATAALQIALMAGARVIAASRSEAKLARARDLGAHETVLFDPQTEADQVRALTGGRGVDVAVEHVGVPTWLHSLRSLAPGGRLTMCGATGGSTVEVDVREIYQRHRKVVGGPLGNKRNFEMVMGLIARGDIDPVIDRVLPMDHIREAHQVLESGEQFGKIVLVP